GPDLVGERAQATPERGAAAELPLRATDDPRVRLDLVRPEHDHYVADGRARPDALEHLGEEQRLFRRAEARRRSGSGDDRRYLQPLNDRQRLVTSCTYAWEARFGAP